MNNEEKSDDLTREIVIEIFSDEEVGKSGQIKNVVKIERMCPDGMLEKITTVKNYRLSCGHVGQVHAFCICERSLCQSCAGHLGTCVVCGRIVCPLCGVKSLIDKGKTYCRKHRLRAIFNRIIRR